jgi:hypothetical protein
VVIDKYCIIAALIIVFNIIVLCDLAQSDNDNIPTKPYTIVGSRDLSMKAITKPPSQYSTYELRSLPLNIRKIYSIVVPSDISKEELKATMKHLVAKEIKKNPDIDEITVFAYDRKEDSDSIYTFGKMEWCPYGKWDGVTPEIASTNDRSSYEYIFDIRNKVGNLSSANKPTKKEFTIYDSFEKELRADLNIDEEILNRRVAKKFGISEKELKQIHTKIMTYNLK